ncbi:MAG: HAMP domain-containing protein, partial [Holophagales bacterium]|nr:HAMP domain-containing protein [Holophagales bacterium]
MRDENPAADAPVADPGEGDRSVPDPKAPDPAAERSSPSSAGLAFTTNAVLRRRPGIRRRLTLGITALVAGVLGAQALFLLFYGRERLHRNVERAARSYAVLAVEPVCEAFRRYHDSGASKFRQLLEQTLELSPDLEGLAIYGVEGRLLYTVDRQGRPAGAAAATRGTDVHAADSESAHAAPAGRLLEAIRGLEQASWHLRGSGSRTGTRSLGGPAGLIQAGEETYVVVQPYTEDWGRRSLTVVFWFGYESAHQAVSRLVWGLGLLGLVALALGTALAWGLAAKSLRPVERLIRGARHLARGNLEHRIQLRSGDELEILGDALDRGASLLQASIADLESSNARLGRLNRELQELDQVKSDLLANVSH